MRMDLTKEENFIENLLFKLAIGNLIDIILGAIFLIIIIFLHIKFHHSWKIDLILLCIAGELALYGGALFFSSEKFLWTIKLVVYCSFILLFYYLFFKIFSTHFIILFFLLIGLNFGLEVFNRIFLKDCIVERKMLFTPHKERKEIIYKQFQESMNDEVFHETNKQENGEGN